jgi:hypothetical protein
MSQLPGLKKKMLTYKDFGNADINAIFSKEQLKDALKLTMNNFSSCLILNKGNGSFSLSPLPSFSSFWSLILSA